MKYLISCRATARPLAFFLCLCDNVVVLMVAMGLRYLCSWEIEIATRGKVCAFPSWFYYIFSLEFLNCMLPLMQLWWKIWTLQNFFPEMKLVCCVISNIMVIAARSLSSTSASHFEVPSGRTFRRWDRTCAVLSLFAPQSRCRWEAWDTRQMMPLLHMGDVPHRPLHCTLSIISGQCPLSVCKKCIY